MTIITWVLSTILDHLWPTPWLGAQPPLPRFALAAVGWSRPATRGQPSGPSNGDLADLHAYQASPQGLIERHVYELAAATAALVQYATAAATRHLVANEAKTLEAVAARLCFVLQVLAGEVRP